MIFSFSIVSHGSGEYVDNLLKYFAANNIHAKFEIIITFNIEEDENFLIKYQHLPILVVRNKSIKGFGKNHNAAFRIASGQYFFVVNPDIEIVSLDEFNLCRILDDFETGVWAPVVYGPSGALEDSARRDPTFLRVAKRFLLHSRNLDYPSINEITEVDWVAGMFMGFHRRSYVRVDGFDEDFHMYYEDADICSRLRMVGLKIRVDINSSVIHYANRKSRKNIKYFIWHITSVFRILFFKKYFCRKI
jgi:GT2 family glycosyltransferase